VVLVPPEKWMLEEGNTLDLIKKVQMVCGILAFLGLPWFLFYRDKLTAPVFAAVVVFCMLMSISYIITAPWPRRAAWCGFLLGAILNQTAVWANGGMMPVKTGTYSHGIWRPMVETDRLKFLCDVCWGSTSVGDWITLGSIVLMILFGVLWPER